MIKIFQTFAGFVELPQVEEGCWINVIQPDENEIIRLHTEFNIPKDIIQDILDADERPRIEFDDYWSMVLLRIPVISTTNGVPFITVPLGIFMTEKYTITICSLNNEILPKEQPSLYKEHHQQVTDGFHFILRLFLRSGNTYLRYLKQINQQTSLIEQDLEQSIRNKELNKLLKMEKCLVYFITSIKANEIVLARLHKSRKNLDEINEDLFEDARIENKQALEMAQIYSDIQSGMMDAFASVISNNLNVVMKQLTSISIILMIPTLIASIYGMNVPNYLENNLFAFPLVIIGSILFSTFGVILFRKKKWF